MHIMSKTGEEGAIKLSLWHRPFLPFSFESYRKLAQLANLQTTDLRYNSRVLARLGAFFSFLRFFPIVPVWWSVDTSRIWDIMSKRDTMVHLLAGGWVIPNVILSGGKEVSKMLTVVASMGPSSVYVFVSVLASGWYRNLGMRVGVRMNVSTNVFWQRVCDQS